MTLILLGIYGVITCVTFLIIYRIRTRKVTTGSAMDDAQERDFLDYFAAHKKKQLAKQPWNMPYETYMTIATVCSILAALVTYLTTTNLVYTGLAILIGGSIPELVVKIQSSSQKSAFEERYARGLKQFAAALKSGMSIHQAIDDVCQSPFVHDSIRKEFQKLSADLKLGIPIKDAFDRFADRVDCTDARDVAIAINIQSSVGGREAEVIESIAKNISDRLMLRKEVNSMFAGSNVLVWTMDIMPFMIIAGMFVFGAGLMTPYTESMTMFMVLIALLAFMVVGSFVIHKQVSDMQKKCGVRQ